MKGKTKLKKMGIVLGMVYVFFTIISQQRIMYRQKNEIIIHKQELKKAKDQNKRIEDEYNICDTELYIERIGREKMGLIKQGEISIIDNSEEEKENTESKNNDFDKNNGK